MDRSLSIAVGGTVLLVVLAGCLSGAGAPQTQPTVSPSPGPDADTPTPVTDGCPSWVSFYGLGDPAVSAWAPDRVAIGYTVPADANVLFVAFDKGSVVGTAHVSTTGLDHGVTADGDTLALEASLEGSHVIRVAAYRDADGNGQFDPETDPPCLADGEVVEAGPRRIDFDAVAAASPSPSGSPSPTAGPPDHEAASDEPAPHKDVTLSNDWSRPVTVQVRVIRNATGQTVHKGSYDLAPDTERDVYDLARADPDGVEPFTVEITARNTTRRVTVETSACYGDVYGEIQTDGSVYLYYAIC
jgi:hypothetical protein